MQPDKCRFNGGGRSLTHCCGRVVVTGTGEAVASVGGDTPGGGSFKSREESVKRQNGWVETFAAN